VIELAFILFVSSYNTGVWVMPPEIELTNLKQLRNSPNKFKEFRTIQKFRRVRLFAN